jgi:hypothetical protein
VSTKREEVCLVGNTDWISFYLWFRSWTQAGSRVTHRSALNYKPKLPTIIDVSEDNMMSCHVTSYSWFNIGLLIGALLYIPSPQSAQCCCLVFSTMELRNFTMMLVAVLLLCMGHMTIARILTPCQVARELHQYGIPRNQLDDCK